MARMDPSDAIPPGELREELERLGSSLDASGPLADRLYGLARALGSRELRRLLDASRTPREAGGASTMEMAHLLEDFATELKKLDEGLRVLTAYLSRLRAQRIPPTQLLH